MKYELIRCRFRYGEHGNDYGPEGGYFRYEIRLGIFNSVEECEKIIEHCEGIPIDIITSIKGTLYQGQCKSTGYPITDPMRKPGFNIYGIGGKYEGTAIIEYDEYWDEYEIREIES